MTSQSKPAPESKRYRAPVKPLPARQSDQVDAIAELVDGDRERAELVMDAVHAIELRRMMRFQDNPHGLPPIPCDTQLLLRMDKQELRAVINGPTAVNEPEWLGPPKSNQSLGRP